MAVKNFEDIRFADQYAGATVSDQIDAAIADMGGTGCVIAPPTMGAGAPSSLFANAVFIDLRPSGGAFKLYSGNVVTPKLSITSAGVVSSAFVSTSSNVATSGTLRLANGDSIVARNAANSANIVLLTTIGDQITLANGGQTTFMNGPLIIAGTFTGATTASFSGQISSSLGTGTAPLSITSTTLVPNLNVATLNGVTVSGAPTSGYYLVATSASTAGWAATPVTYKFENYSATPSAAAVPFSWTVPNNELAAGQSFRVIAHGVFSNGATASNMVQVLKYGTTTLATVTFGATGAGALANIGWRVEFLVTCTVAGVSGTVESSGFCMGNIAQFPSLAPSANTATQSFDTTSSQALTLNISATNSGSWSARQWTVERLG